MGYVVHLFFLVCLLLIIVNFFYYLSNTVPKFKIRKISIDVNFLKVADCMANLRPSP